MQIDVSIIIINYNTCQITKNCLDSIFKKTKGISYEVILVDNASIDGSKEVFQADSRIKYVYSDENLGFGRGNNLGYQYASGDYIFLLNSDTLLINNAVYELYSFMSKHPEFAITGGSLYDSEMQPCHSYGLMLPSFKQELNTLFRGRLGFKNKDKIKADLLKNGNATVGYITGADMMLRRSLIEEVGFFDPDFFMYYEETEMTYRYFKKKYKSVYYPKAKIQHLEGKSFTIKEARERVFFESRRLYYEKVYESKRYYYCCCAVFFLYLLSSLLFNLLKFNLQATSNVNKRIHCFLKYAL